MKVLKIILAVLLTAGVIYSVTKPKQIERVVEKTVTQETIKEVAMTPDDASVVAVLAKRVEAVENKLMTNFIPESTDRIFTNTDPKSPRVVKRGRFDITLSSAGSVGVYGQASVDVTIMNGAFLMPRCDVMIEYAGGFTSYEQLPYTKMNTDGTVLSSAYYAVNYQAQPAPSENKVFLTIVMYHRSASLNSSYQGTYIVYSDAWANPNDPESSY